MKDMDCWAGLFLIGFSFLGAAFGKQIVQLKSQGLSAAFFPNRRFVGLFLYIKAGNVRTRLRFPDSSGASSVRGLLCWQCIPSRLKISGFLLLLLPLCL